MSNKSQLGSKQIPYIVSISLYFFWIQCITWACRLLTLTTAGQSRLAFNYSFFYFSLAAGCFVFAWWLDSNKTLGIMRIKGMGLVSTLVTCILTFASRFTYEHGITVVLSISGFTAGFIVALLQRFMITQIPQSKRGLALGSAVGTALFINFILFILFAPAGGSTALYTKAYADSQATVASIIFLITGLTAIGFFGNTIYPPQAFHDNITPGTPAEIKPKFIIMVFLLCFFFYLNIGIQDHMTTLSWFTEGNAMFFTRIFSLLGAFVTGLICDRKGRHMLIVSSLVLLAAGLIPMMLSYHGVLAFLSLSLVQLAYMAFDISIKLIMVDMALYSKKPVLIASLGFGLPYIMRQAGTLFGSFLAEFGTVPVFVTLVLLLILPSPFLTMLFDEIRNMYLDRLKIYNTSHYPVSFNDNPMVHEADTRLSNALNDYSSNINYEDVIQGIRNKCGLTVRETEVLQLVLLGQTIKEMAQNLYISEVTIKTHIGRILKKTGAKNRAQLFSVILHMPDHIGNITVD